MSDMGADRNGLVTATPSNHEPVVTHRRPVMVIDIPSGYLPDATHSARITTWSQRVGAMNAHREVRTTTERTNERNGGLPVSGRLRVDAQHACGPHVTRVSAYRGYLRAVGMFVGLVRPGHQ